jgi:uncharacterized protein (TIGR03083 family)
MDADELLAHIRHCIGTTTGQVADLVASIPDPTVLAPDSLWTLQELCAHLIVAGGFLTDIAQGTPSPMEGLDPAYHKPQMARWSADIAETDPGKLSRLLVDAVEGFLDATSDVPGDLSVIFHGGFPYTVAGVAGVLLGEEVLHGYDIATTLGRPWPVDPVAAQLVLAAYAPAFRVVGHPERTWGLSLGAGIELRGVGEMTVRVIDGVHSLDEGEGPVDCSISVDPVALLMMGAGRLSRYEAIALGLMGTHGDHQEVAFGFPDLFLDPRALRGFCTSQVRIPRNGPRATGSASGARRPGGGGG